MRSVLGSLLGLVGGAVFLLVFLSINGGYVYRTQCARVGGSTETDWSYRIFDVIPYLGYSRSGCEVHTAPRVALDAIGIWKIHGGSPTPTASPDHRGEYTATQRAVIQSNCVGKGNSGSFCRCAMEELTRRFSPGDLAQISAVTRYDQLPGDLGHRAKDATTAIDQGCH